MAQAHIEIDDMELTLEEYENYVGGQEGVEHPLGFSYEKQYSTPDKNGAVI